VHDLEDAYRGIRIYSRRLLACFFFASLYANHPRVPCTSLAHPLASLGR